MSLDTDDNVSLDVLTSLLIVIIIMHLLLDGLYRFALSEKFFILNLTLIVHVNLQTSEKSKRRALSIILISLSFVVLSCLGSSVKVSFGKTNCKIQENIQDNTTTFMF